MTWFRVDDSFHSHPKTLQAGNVAIGLWIRCGSYCAQHLTDGYVPADVALMYGNTSAAKKLLAADLWVPERDGWTMHDYLVYNPSRAQVLTEREANSRRAALHRDPQLVAAVRFRDGNACRYCGVAVNWKNRRGSTGGTYSHVDPVGPNSFGNLVIACRGCDTRKGSQTPQEAGMTPRPI